jgi:hypothetical protein
MVPTSNQWTEKETDSQLYKTEPTLWQTIQSIYLKEALRPASAREPFARAKLLEISIRKKESSSCVYMHGNLQHPSYEILPEQKRPHVCHRPRPKPAHEMIPAGQIRKKKMSYNRQIIADSRGMNPRNFGKTTCRRAVLNETTDRLDCIW